MPAAVEVVGPYRFDRLRPAHARARAALRAARHGGPAAPSGLVAAAAERCVKRGSTSCTGRSAPAYSCISRCRRRRPLNGIRNINYTMFKADRIPAVWAARAAGHDCTVTRPNHRAKRGSQAGSHRIAFASARSVSVQRATIVNIDRVREIHPLFRGDCALSRMDGGSS